jgi:hypothetical protein
MPLDVNGSPTMQLTFSSLQISRYHALIDLAANFKSNSQLSRIHKSWRSLIKTAVVAHL